MKQIMTFLLSVCMLFIMTACTSQNASTALAAEETASSDTDIPTNETKLQTGDKIGSFKENETNSDNILVAYFSNTGTTEQIAEWIAEQFGADIYEIIPENPYNPVDLDYGNSSSRSTAEQNNLSARPVIAKSDINIDKYSTVFLGYPIWSGQAPRIISTFLESYDFSGKNIIPFCTSHSSGIGSSDINLYSLCSNTVTWLEGKRFSSETTKEEVAKWLEGFNITINNKLAIFNFETKKVLLNSGYEMPIVGLGTYSLMNEVCVNSVSEALKAGGRLIDTAYMYHNEESVGQGIRESGIPREEIFITTKLYPSQFTNADEAIDDALEKLNVEYIDLMLLHHPGNGDLEAYKAMERAVNEGKIHSIGLSNWYVEELEEFLPQITIIPAVIQNEIHPYYQENDVIPYIQEKGIVMEGWYPLGGRGHTADLLGDKTISAIARTHGKSSAQVILRWNLQKGVVVIPGSSNPEHIKENLDIFDFTLTDDEMEQINLLDRKEKHDWY